MEDKLKTLLRKARKVLRMYATEHGQDVGCSVKSKCRCESCKAAREVVMEIKALGLVRK